MLRLEPIANMKARHSFRNDLGCTTVDQWMRDEDINDYDNVLKKTVNKLKKLDRTIETLIRKPDVDMRLALGRAYFKDGEMRIADLIFKPYLPCGRIQLQLGLVDTMIGEIEGARIPQDDVQALNMIQYRTEWELNPHIGKVFIGNKEVNLRLRSAVSLYRGYLSSCDHEFRKQEVASKMDSIMHNYHMLLSDHGYLNGKEPENKLIDNHEWISNYWRANGLLDRIYYRRASQFFEECRQMHGFLEKNDFSRPYTMEETDVKMAVDHLSRRP